MSRRHEEEHEGSSERWLLTYSDMITLLLALFIMLYTISTVDQGKYQALSTQLGIAFNGGRSILETGTPGGGNGSGSGTGSTPDATPIGGNISTPAYTQEDIARLVGSLIESNGLSSMASVDVEERGVVISFQDALLFDSGSADINAKSQDMLKKLTVIANSCKNFIRVEGSTDDVPISGRFASNWELASQRAINVAKTLVGFGVSASRISATSYGEFRPLVPNDTSEHRRLNRRVDIVFLNQQFNGSEPGYTDNKGASPSPGSSTSQSPSISPSPSPSHSASPKPSPSAGK